MQRTAINKSEYFKRLPYIANWQKHGSEERHVTVDGHGVINADICLQKLQVIRKRLEVKEIIIITVIRTWLNAVTVTVTGECGGVLQVTRGSPGMKLTRRSPGLRILWPLTRGAGSCRTSAENTTCRLTTMSLGLKLCTCTNFLKKVASELDQPLRKSA